jgi:hypothetical protein
MSWAFGRPLVKAIWPDRLQSYSAEITKRHKDLLSYIIFLRVRPRPRPQPSRCTRRCTLLGTPPPRKIALPQAPGQLCRAGAERVSCRRR